MGVRIDLRIFQCLDVGKLSMIQEMKPKQSGHRRRCATKIVVSQKSSSNSPFYGLNCAPTISQVEALNSIVMVFGKRVSKLAVKVK